MKNSRNLTDFGELCYRARGALAMTKPELAKRISTTPLDISNIECGKKLPSPTYISLVTSVLGMDASEVQTAIATLDKHSYQLTKATQSRYGAQDA